MEVHSGGAEWWFWVEVTSGGALWSSIVEVHYGGSQWSRTVPKSTKVTSSLFIPWAIAISLFIHCSLFIQWTTLLERTSCSFERTTCSLNEQLNELPTLERTTNCSFNEQLVLWKNNHCSLFFQRQLFIQWTMFLNTDFYLIFVWLGFFSTFSFLLSCFKMSFFLFNRIHCKIDLVLQISSFWHINI